MLSLGAEVEHYIGLYSGSMGIMEKKMETTIMENQMEKKMENEMEAGRLRRRCFRLGFSGFENV